MDIYTLLAKLRKARRKHTISAGAQGLFQELMAINNEERWSKVFRCPNGELCGALNISEKTLAFHRQELIAAGLLGYDCGKSRRIPSNYSLDGSSFDSLDGSIFYHHTEHQQEHRRGEKTPDLIREKSKEIREIHLEVDDDDKALARKNEIEEAITDHTSNVAFPQQAHLPDEKEKSCSKKEKVLPAMDDMINRIVENGTCHWWNVIEFYLAKGINWGELDEPGRQVYYDQRQELFKKFYAGKRDNYLIRLPTCNDIAQNFYNWVPSELNRETLQKLNNHAINRAKNGNNGHTKNNASGTRNERNSGIADVIERSTDFLQQNGGLEYP